MPLLTRRAVVQAAMESVYGDAAAVGASDGLLIADPQYVTDPAVLERNFVRDTLSQQAHLIGRMMARQTFQTELRGNGRQDSGIIGDAPLIARLFRACGYALTAKPAAFAGTVYEQGDHANTVAWASGGVLTNTDVIFYRLEVITPGASGTATIAVTSDTAGEGSAAAVVTTATPFVVGTEGLTLTPTFTGSLVAGQVWHVWVFPIGLLLAPVSTGFESIHLVMNKDGVKHSTPGSFGTFEITAEAGQFATVNWNFQGLYIAPTDTALPSLTYEKTLPAQVELARLRVDAFSAVVNRLSFNQNNDITIRPDVNSSQGFIGTRITARRPEGGIDPEADTVANQDFWGKIRAATRMPFQMRVGQVPGNTIWMIAPNTQYTRMTYQDRNGLLTYDAGLKFASYAGDDEVLFYLS